MKIMAITACLGLMGQTQPTPESLLSDPRFQERVIPSPNDPAQWPAFQSELIAYRDAIRQQLNYSDALYRDPKTAWSATAFSCGFIMLNDSVIYDPTTNQFTPDKFINEYMPQFGGFDCVVLWHAYPRLGFDDRNQFDFYKDQPGGLAGLKSLVDALHKHNVRVLLPYLPWDRSTRNDGTTHAQSLAACVKALGADGVYLDTMDKATPELRKELDHLPSGMVYDSEGTTPIEDIAHHQNSWGQWVKDSDVPGVIRNKWIEPRHMVRIVERWDRDHSDEIAMAWMNGAGIVVWENVFGTWVGWNELDKSLLRGSLPVQRHFGNLFTGANLTPCVPTESPAIFANRWQEPGVELYTLVNRLIDERQGNLLKVPYKPGYRYFNLFSGDEITPIDGQVILQGPIAGRALVVW
ncbi:MAG: hypothetical protein HC898_11000 [Phycisphaerales bacterium]|nr:hypothetical protein [Phycisphaerales bacterium]